MGQTVCFVNTMFHTFSHTHTHFKSHTISLSNCIIAVCGGPWSRGLNKDMSPGKKTRSGGMKKEEEGDKTEL